MWFRETMTFYWDPKNQSDRSKRIENYELARFRRERPGLVRTVQVVFYACHILVPYLIYLAAKSLYESHVEQKKDQDRVAQDRLKQDRLNQARARIIKRAAELEEQQLQTTKVSG